jgi:hypothetical protein
MPGANEASSIAHSFNIYKLSPSTTFIRSETLYGFPRISPAQNAPDRNFPFDDP